VSRGRRQEGGAKQKIWEKLQKSLQVAVFTAT
jgi:hypothetical protein